MTILKPFMFVSFVLVLWKYASTHIHIVIGLGLTTTIANGDALLLTSEVLHACSAFLMLSECFDAGPTNLPRT